MNEKTGVDVEAMRGHTAGEWYVNDTPVHSDVRVASEQQDCCDPIIVEFPYGIDTEQQKADARLIAVAPKLLAEVIRLRAEAARFAQLLEAAQELHDRFKPIRDDLIFSKRMALDRLGTAILICTAPATPKERTT